MCACAFKCSESYIGNASSRRHRLPNKMSVAECGGIFPQFAGQRGTIESPQAIQTVVIALSCCISLCCGNSGFLVVIKYFEHKQLGEECIFLGLK